MPEVQQCTQCGRTIESGELFVKFRATPGNTFESPLDLLLSKHSARELNAGSWVTRLGPQLHRSTVAFLHQCMYLKIAISALVSMLLCQSLSAQSREHMEKALYEVNS